MFELALATQLNTSEIDRTKLENRETESNRIELATKDRNNADFQFEIADTRKSLNSGEMNNKVETGLETYKTIPNLELQNKLGGLRVDGEIIAQYQMQQGQYLGQMGRQNMANYCRRLSSSGSLESISLENKIITCREPQLGVSLPFGITIGNESVPVQHNLDNICQDKYQEYSVTRAPFGGSVYSSRVPKYQNIEFVNWGCYNF
jgi:hypothetical protein